MHSSKCLFAYGVLYLSVCPPGGDDSLFNMFVLFKVDSLSSDQPIYTSKTLIIYRFNCSELECCIIYVRVAYILKPNWESLKLKFVVVLYLFTDIKEIPLLYYCLDFMYLHLKFYHNSNYKSTSFCALTEIS